MIRRRKEGGLTDGLRILPAVNLLCGIHFLIDPCRSRIKEKSPDLGQGRGLLKIKCFTWIKEGRAPNQKGTSREVPGPIV